jgi:2'-5' RNA ligase
VRLFFAIELPGAVREDLRVLIENLRARVRGVRWVESGRMHLTLRFLGEIEPGRLEPLCEAARRAAAVQPGLRLRTGGLGMFPARGRARVVWVAVESEEERLQALQTGLEDFLHGAGFGREDRPFSPHLTIGRVQPGADPRRELQGATGPPSRGFEAGEFVLIESRLRPEGAAYEVRSRFPLERVEAGDCSAQAQG